MLGILRNNALPSKYEKLYLNADLADVNFVFNTAGETEYLPANKAILAIVSPVFQKMFFGAMKETNDVMIADVRAAPFKEFLQFFYLTEVSLTKENVFDVVQLAHKYDMPKCFDDLIDFLPTNLTLDTMCMGYQLAIIFNIENLKIFCESKIEMFPLEVFESRSFLHSDKCVLKNILKMDFLRCDESHVFRACLEWGKSSCEHGNVTNLRDQLDDCLNLIRYGSMKVEKFAAVLTSYRGLFTLDELEDIVLSMTIKGYKSEKFNPMLRPRMGCFKSVDNTTVKCTRVNYKSEPTYFIKPRESTFFSTNHILVLGKIYFECLGNLTSRQPDLTFTVKVIELIGTVGDQIEHVMHQKFCAYDKLFFNFLHLPLPLVIKPERMYEIRVESEDPMQYGLYHETHWLEKIFLNEEIVVKFHHDSTVGDGERRGLVNSLYFNLN